MDKAENTVQEPAVLEARVGDLLYLTVTASDPEAAYRSAADALAEAGATPVLERIFASLGYRQDVRAARQAELGRILDPASWPATYIQGNPAGGIGMAGLHMVAVSGANPTPVRDGGRAVGAILEQPGIRRVFLGNLQSPEVLPDPAAQAREMYAETLRLLDITGSDFKLVARTWIYLSDILSWYGEFNKVRTKVFRDLALISDTSNSNVPASTGIEGTPPDGSLCAMDLIAVEGPGIEMRPLDSPRQCGATKYGSMFARAMLVSEAAGDTVYVSGTAAIDDAGCTVLLGDLEGQARHTLDTIDALIGQVGLSIRDLTGATVFIKRGGDPEVVRQVFEEVAPNLLRMPFVEADVCRDDLLFEVDGMAVKPR
jgi:enamine deaminase RidA (YjgF/YER057c/UK114 family)